MSGNAVFAAAGHNAVIGFRVAITTHEPGKQRATISLVIVASERHGL